MTLKTSWWQLLLFVMICYLVAAFGAQFTPGAWYENLSRAPWNPPNFVFPVVWTILYLLIAIAGWRIFAGNDPVLKTLWVVQLALNAAWSWMFFGQHWVGIALLDIILLVVVLSLLIIRCFNQSHRLAGGLLTPYFVWIVLATSLNFYIFAYN